MKYLGVVLVLSLIGIEHSYGFIRYFHEMRNNCAREGGFCINIIPPPLPRRRWNRRRGPARGRMPRTKTKKGTRNNRGRGAAGAGAGPGPGPGAAGQGSAANPAYQPMQPAWQPPQQPRQQQNSFFSGFNPLWFMFGTRKKRQAQAEPPEPGEIPRIRRNENVGAFLNQHCRSTEFDFGCERTGGVCCTPIP